MHVVSRADLPSVRESDNSDEAQIQQIADENERLEHSIARQTTVRPEAGPKRAHCR